MVINYCKKCILPNTRPNLEIDSMGICNCSSSEKADAVDWNERENKFVNLVTEVKSLNRDYDCLIPVSGGKDSTWQVITALNAGLHPLCVTWKTPARNSLGQKNLDNLISLGVDHIDVTVNPKVEKLFTLKAFKRFGSPVIPMHMAIHAIPMKVALEKNIPIILWGENSATEYGGSASDKGIEITRSWLKKYGVTFGTSAEDWIDDELSLQNLSIYRWPSEEKLESSSIRAVFLGEFFNWNPRATAKIAKQHGFKEAENALVGQFNFADVDDAFLMSIHHWMKWYKFGITRSWDNISLDIKSGLITREKALKLIQDIGDETPHQAIEEFCCYVNISKNDFFAIAETFRDQSIWKKKGDKWMIKDFIIPDFDWSIYEN